MSSTSNERIITETQVAVIGAGAIGCSIAYHLARGGASVVVIDAHGIASGTSSATLGLVWVQQKPPAEYLELNLLSSLLHRGLVKDFDTDVELNQPGGVDSYLDEAYFEEQVAVMQQLNAACPKYQAQALTPDQARQMEPELSQEIVGAIYCPHDGEINPITLVHNFAHSARKLGAKFLTHVQGECIAHNDSGVTGIQTSQGLIRSSKVVVAAGIACSALLHPLGIKLPQVFERGQILVTEPMRRVLIHPTDISRQTVRGNILLGTTHEPACLERHATTIDGLKYIVDQSIRRFPVLKSANFIRSFSGIRPLPKDGLPFLGPVRRVPGLYVATSHSGITLAPVHGKVISELILHGRTEVPIQNYQPERFMDLKAE